MNSLKPSTHQPLFDRLFTLALLTAIAYSIAIAASTVSAVASAAGLQQCPTGTVLNPQTHACELVKAPAVAAPAPVIKAPAPVLNIPPPAACNGHGSMSSMGTCICASGWSGSSCQSMSTAAPQQCPYGTYGATCQACPGGVSSVCSSHGSCSQGVAGNGQCTCSFGFTGVACQFSNGTSQ
jgi:hypothetical protein